MEKMENIEIYKRYGLNKEEVLMHWKLYGIEVYSAWPTEEEWKEIHKGIIMAVCYWYNNKYYQ